MADVFQKKGRFPGIILAGGLSSRMGRNKALVIFGRETMLQHVITRIRPQVSALALNADTDWQNSVGLRHVPDTLSGKLGPLSGVLAAMRDTARHHPSASHVLTVPTDAPLLPHNLMQSLESVVDTPQSIAVAKSAGALHPVVALWPVTLADELEAWILADEKRRVRHFLQKHHAVEVDFPLIDTTDGMLDPFININTPEELVAAEKWLE